jgi:hypothetical protein
MKDLPREQILALIDQYGPDVLDMSQTVATELQLACPGRRAEVDGLVAALRHGVVHYLLVLAEAGKIETADLPAQVLRLCAEAGLNEVDARRAVGTWADIIGTMSIPREGDSAWRREPRALHRARFAGLRDPLIVGLTGLLASMLPWLVVLEEKRGHHFLIPVEMDLLGTHALLNLLGAVGGFLGGALGWMLGSPLSLEFQESGGLASAHRVIAASLAAGLGSFFGLWLGYHHLADIGTFFGPFLGAGIGAFLASIYTFTYRRMGAWDK